MVQIPNAFRVIGDLNAYPFHAVTSEMTFLLYCDAIIFLVFMLLDAVQWFVSACVNSLSSPNRVFFGVKLRDATAGRGREMGSSTRKGTIPSYLPVVSTRIAFPLP